MLENLLWIAASAVLFVLLVLTVVGGCIEYKRLKAEDELMNPGKSDISEKELCFPEMSRFELDMAMLHARRTDKLLAKHRRNRYTGYRR